MKAFSLMVTYLWYAISRLNGILKYLFIADYMRQKWCYKLIVNK